LHGQPSACPLGSNCSGFPTRGGRTDRKGADRSFDYPSKKRHLPITGRGPRLSLLPPAVVSNVCPAWRSPHRKPQVPGDRPCLTRWHLADSVGGRSRACPPIKATSMVDFGGGALFEIAVSTTRLPPSDSDPGILSRVLVWIFWLASSRRRFDGFGGQRIPGSSATGCREFTTGECGWQSDCQP
jgi:hypothetical protein